MRVFSDEPFIFQVINTEGVLVVVEWPSILAVPRMGELFELNTITSRIKSSSWQIVRDGPVQIIYTIVLEEESHEGF